MPKISTIIKNNELHDEKGIAAFVKRELKKLETIKKRSRIFWSITTLLIALCNIAVVTIAVIALIGISEKGGGALLPASLVCLVTISLFVMGFVLAFYQNLKKDHLYKSAIDTIQNEYMKYSNNVGVYDIESEAEKDKIMKKQIKKDLTALFKPGKRISKWKIFFNALIGDKDE